MSPHRNPASHRLLQARRDRRGGALVLALFVVIVVTALGASFLQLNLARTKAIGMSLDNKRAFYIAESGLAEAYWGLTTGRTGQVGSVDAPAGFGNGLFWVDAETVGSDAIQLESTGMFGRGRATLGLVVRAETDEGGGSGGFAVNQAFATSNSSLIDGYDSSLGTYASQADLTAVPIHTDTGAQVLSNGDITIGKDGAVYGDVTPAPFGAVTLNSGAYVSGGTSSAPSLFVLPPVELPGLTLPGTDIVWNGPGPLILPASSLGYGSIQVGPGAEVRLQGPMTLEASEIILHSSATLTVDSAAGPVDVFVKSNLTLNSGASVVTTTEDPTQTTFQVAAKDKKKTSVSLNASSAFYGYIYAPEAGVQMSSDFELFGGLGCDMVQMGNGVRIHVDAALFDGGGGGSAVGPQVLSWRVVDIPESVPQSVKNPFDGLGVTSATLAKPDDAHVGGWLQVKWSKADGTSMDFEGWESDFDWSLVSGFVKSMKVYDGPGLDKLLYFKG